MIKATAFILWEPERAKMAAKPPIFASVYEMDLPFWEKFKIGKLFGHQHSYLWGLSKFMIWAMPGVL